MAPKANPNPDRARRGGDTTLAVTAAAPAAAPTPAPTPAPRDMVAAPAAPLVTPTAAAPATSSKKVFGLMPVRATGLQQPQPTGGKRTASVVREDVAWQCVEITDEEDPKNPRWRCRGCLT